MTSLMWPVRCSQASNVHPLTQELAASWQPISFTVAAVQLIARPNYHEPFRIRWEVPLGGQQKPALVDVPYVATAGDTVVPPGGLVSCWAMCCTTHVLLMHHSSSNRLIAALPQA